MVMDSVDKLQSREGENADRQTSSSDLETTVGSGPDDTSTAGGGGGKKVSVTSSSSTSSGISQFLSK